jgi:hypothetical protein
MITLGGRGTNRIGTLIVPITLFLFKRKKEKDLTKKTKTTPKLNTATRVNNTSEAFP